MGKCYNITEKNKLGERYEKIGTLVGMILLSILIISEYQEVNANQTEISSEIETSKQTEEATSDVQETTMKQQETTVNHQEFVTENNLAGWVKTNITVKKDY